MSCLILGLGALDRGDEIAIDISATEQDFQSATASHQPWKARHGAAPQGTSAASIALCERTAFSRLAKQCHRPAQARCHLDVRISFDRGNHFVELTRRFLAEDVERRIIQGPAPVRLA